MTVYEFILLKKDEQANAVWDGVFIADRVLNKMNFELYSVSDFFVELVYDKKQNKIIRMRPFESRRLLEPYIRQVDLAEIKGLL